MAQFLINTFIVQPLFTLGIIVFGFIVVGLACAYSAMTEEINERK